jgi:hypothetical protein
MKTRQNQMKAAWKFITIIIGTALLVAACGPTITPPNPAATDAPIIADIPLQLTDASPVEAQASAAQNPRVVAVAVDTLPVIDADSSDEQWKEAPVTQIGGMQWQTVYTDEYIALLLKWIDKDLSMDTPGTYIWDASTGAWSMSQVVSREWMNLSFNIQNAPVTAEGCFAFCHEDPPGSGLYHHQTETAGELVDSWMLFEKHGFEFKYVKGVGGVETEDAYGLKSGAEDRLWFMGNIEAKQNGPLVFETTNTANPRNILAGSLTFIDYAEDNIIASPDDPIDTNRDRPRDLYCINCHAQIGLPYDPMKLNFTLPDSGEIKYSGNYEIPFTTPSYMETEPGDFVDSMIITQDEVDNGEAIAVKDLTPDQISGYWAKYEALNGVVPQLVLKAPSGGIADVLVASNWTNGVWTMEITRKLVTADGIEDVQFVDLNKEYPFSLTITNSGMLLGPLLYQTGGILEFKQ